MIKLIQGLKEMCAVDKTHFGHYKLFEIVKLRLFIFFVLAVLHDLWDLSSFTREPACAPYSEHMQS